MCNHSLDEKTQKRLDDVASATYSDSDERRRNFWWNFAAVVFWGIVYLLLYILEDWGTRKGFLPLPEWACQLLLLTALGSTCFLAIWLDERKTRRRKTPTSPRRE